MMPSRPSLVRWRALGPLAGFLTISMLLWFIMADRVVRVSLEEVGTQVLGTQVDVEWLRILESRAAVELGGLTIADPFDSDRNLIEVGRLEVLLDPEPLLEKKVLIRTLVLEQVAVATSRVTPASPVPGGGILTRIATMVEPWRARLEQPFVGFSGADSIRNLVVNPDELLSVRSARRLALQADSARLEFLGDVVGLDASGLVEEGRALTTRVAEADPARLGLGGMRQLVSDAGAYSARLDDLEERLEGLERQAGSTLDRLDDGVAGLDQARQEDLRRVQAAVGLPGLEGPAIGGNLFGPMSLSYLEHGLYWVELVRQYMPPGLKPWSTPGRGRSRASGSTIRFPKQGRTPSFLLEAGMLRETASEPQDGRRHELRLANLTTEPALVEGPTQIHFARSTDGSVEVGFDAVMDHSQAVALDSMRFLRRGDLPTIALPGLPLTADLGAGVTQLRATIDGDRFVAALTVDAPAVAWTLVEAQGAAVSVEQRLLMEVLAGLRELHITAEVAGSSAGLHGFEVRSNVDEGVARHLESLAGEAVRLARQRARSEVDRISQSVIDSAVARTGLARSVIDDTTAEWRTTLEGVRRQLEEQIRRKTGGIGGMIGMLTPIDGSPSYSK